jgi:hypothetical protein
MPLKRFSEMFTSLELNPTTQIDIEIGAVVTKLSTSLDWLEVAIA